jgi:hypothetical protein
VEWSHLSASVEEKIAAINLHLKELEYSKDELGFAIRTSLASVRFALMQSDMREHQIKLHVFYAPVFLRQEFATRVYTPSREPQRSSEQTFHFDYNAAFGWCWREGSKNEFLTSESLSELLMNKLLEAHQKVEAGGTPRRARGHAPGTPWS